MSSIVSAIVPLGILGAVGCYIIYLRRSELQKRKLAPSKDEVHRKLEDLAKDCNDSWLVDLCRGGYGCPLSHIKYEDIPNEITGNLELAITKLLNEIDIFDYFYNEAIYNWNIKEDFIERFKKCVLNNNCLSLRKKRKRIIV